MDVLDVKTRNVENVKNGLLNNFGCLRCYMDVSTPDYATC